MSCLSPWRCSAPARRLLLSSSPGLRALPPTGVRSFRQQASGGLAHDNHKNNDEAVAASTPNPLLNPPASTLPPPMTLPIREACDSAPQYYFQLGKAYIKFYKDGVKSAWANGKLLREKLARTPADDRPSVFRPYHVPRTFSRADWVMFWRVRHDQLRLPFFGLMLLVIGEFTALVVIYADGVVPYTCRIPRQIYSTLQAAEKRREASFADLEAAFPQGVLDPRMNAGVARAHLLRSLHLSGAMWDRLAFTPPGMWAVKGRLRMAFLEGDDKNLVEDGGVIGLEDNEVRIACSERGIDVLGKGSRELRELLGDWLRLTAADEIDERRRRMLTLLMTRVEHWPRHRNFALPAWTL